MIQSKSCLHTHAHAQTAQHSKPPTCSAIMSQLGPWRPSTRQSKCLCGAAALHQPSGPSTSAYVCVFHDHGTVLLACVCDHVGVCMSMCISRRQNTLKRKDFLRIVFGTDYMRRGSGRRSSHESRIRKNE